MKSFKEMVVPVEEATGGKGHHNFKGTDEIGDFWVVTKTSKLSVLQDIFFKVDIFDMALQLRGGLDGSDIIGIYKKESNAKKVAEKELAKGGK
jgi:hypothetical protein